jgi:hypothetical protein
VVRSVYVKLIQVMRGCTGVFKLGQVRPCQSMSFQFRKC